MSRAPLGVLVLLAIGNLSGLGTPGRAFLFSAQFRQHRVDVGSAHVTGAGKPVGDDTVGVEHDDDRVGDTVGVAAEGVVLVEKAERTDNLGAGVGQHRAYYRLKQNVRRLRGEARQLASSLGEGAGQDETLPVYEHMMQTVREARSDASQVFLTSDVQERASAVRGLLNQLSPYYDPDAVPLTAPVR